MAHPERVLSVVVPCYNEAATLREILRRVAAQPAVGEILVVDDGSTDGTREVLRETVNSWPESSPPLRVFFQPENRGKGAALREGFRRARFGITLVQDADLEYDPRDYARLVAPILEGNADVVYGSRFEGFPRRVLFFWHALGNLFLTTLSNMTTNLNLTDMETGYKAFKTGILQGIPIRCARFGFEPEITAKIAKLGCRIYEVPISYHGRGYNEGKKIGWRDGLKAVAVILKYWLVDDLGLPTEEMTLKLLEKAGRYNRWIYETIRPYLGKEILEVGAGTGTLTRYLVASGQVTATDISPFCLGELRRAFAGHGGIAVHELDIRRNSFPEREAYDTVVCLNVLEHIEDDTAALSNMRRLLRQGGRVVLFVPANPRLYGEIDRGVGHFRRYVKENLVGKMQRSGFEVTHARYHNPIGGIGWWIHGKVFRKRRLTGREIRGFDSLLPLLGLQERFETRLSQSLLAVGCKRGH